MNPQFQGFVENFDRFSKTHFAHRRAEASDIPQLFDSMEYSFFNGGKRFRPLLCFSVAEALGLKEEQILAFAMAVECIHTYSLIHDDLPCMDDDKERRGQPTNHIQFSESMALLAGDSLLTEAFLVLAKYYPKQNLKLVELLSENSGPNGMIRGQVLDLGLGHEINELSDLINLHQLKTGRLISLCFQGPALLADKNFRALGELGLMIGLAFQVKDDLLDIDEDDQMSFVAFLGESGTRDYLQNLSEKIQQQINELDLGDSLIKDLVDFNSNRNQ